MAEYFLKVIVCSSLFFGFYFFFLQKEKIFTFNRIYLLVTLLLSLSIPLFIITLPEESNKVESVLLFNKHINIVPKENEVYNGNKSVIKSQEIYIDPRQTVLMWYTFFRWESIILFLYVTIATFFIIRFLVNFFTIYKKIIRGKKICYNGIFLIINENKEELYSFWNYIFIPKHRLEENISRRELLDHEIAHITQKHSIDILLVEIIKSVFWFNPVFYLYKKVIQLNHEFLADAAVLKTETDVYEYQKLILNTIRVRQTVSIASNFNYVLTKKRLLMITRKGNSFKAFILQLFSIPFVLILVYIFSNKVYAKKNSSHELLPKQEEQQQNLNLELHDKSSHLKDTLVNNSQNFIDTLIRENKVYEISSKENHEEIFTNNKHQKFSKLPKDKIVNSRESKEIYPKKINKLTESRVDKEQKKFYENSISYKVPLFNENEQEIPNRDKEVSDHYKSLKIKGKITNEEISIHIEERTNKINLGITTSQSVNKSSEKSDMDEFREEMRKFKQEMRGLGKQIRNLSKS